MSFAQYALNAGLLVFILASNLGTRSVTRWRPATSMPHCSTRFGCSRMPDPGGAVSSEIV